jgi:hypothetical protein
MLDIEGTRKAFNNWVRSPAFDGQFNAIAKRAVWPFVAGGVLMVSVVGIIPGIGLLIYGWRRESARKAARRDAHLAFSSHVPILCTLVIGNRDLFRKKGAMAPALLVGGFDCQDEAALNDTLQVAFLIAKLYGQDPARVEPEHREACMLVNDDTFRPDRRRPVPSHLSPNRKLWLFDTILLGDHFDSGSIDNPFIPCMATPGPQGLIAQLPPGVAVFKTAKREPNIIHHKAPVETPPLVAPLSENLEAIEAHIARHLGEPASVFHELISTTVHIDIHIVRPSRERPWISLVTSGMSDIPMNAPEGSEAWRFAELMIRLPADWKLDEESLKDEAHYWPLRWLKNLARFAHEYETWLSYGHSIPNGNPPVPLGPGVPFSGVVLSSPWYGGEEFTTLYLPDGTPVHFWSLIPVYPSEMDFKLEHGSDALFGRLGAAGYSDLLEPARQPVA